MGRRCPSAALGGADVSPDRYIKHVKTLSDESMKGRGNDLPELKKAARYMADQLKACGVKPVNGAWFQKFRATTGTAIGNKNALSIAFENVANLDRLPPAGATIVALPMKLAGGTGGPLRIIAAVEP